MTQPTNWQDPTSEDFPTGPAIGEPAPDFALPDQFGNLVRFSEARGTNQALVLFHRSASW